MDELDDLNLAIVTYAVLANSWGKGQKAEDSAIDAILELKSLHLVQPLAQAISVGVRRSARPFLIRDVETGGF